jgi:hypothetical protein
VRRSKEIIVLAVLLAGMAGYVLWYVIDRRAQARTPPPVAAKPVPPAAPVDLTQHDGQTIDFSSGRPVVKDSAADRAAIAKAKQEMDEAVKDITFGPPPQTGPEPAKKPAPSTEPAVPKKD